jgi:HPr kinase/phosphorylase
MLVHATTVDIAGLGVLILGESGAGKSDLALRLIAAGALLVADDRTDVTIAGDALRATSPATILGLLEARGVGIIRAATTSATRLRLAVSLIVTLPERMPELRAWSLPGHTKPSIPLIELGAFEASTVEKVRRALTAVPDA